MKSKEEIFNLIRNKIYKLIEYRINLERIKKIIR